MSPILGIWASQNYSRYSLPTSFESIATQSVSSAVSSVTFSSIPSTYTHLQLRAIARTSAGYLSDAINLRFNSDTGSNYVMHYLQGDGVNASATVNTAQNNLYVSARMPGGTATASIFGAGVIDILDYTNTNKNKVIRSLNGFDPNTTDAVVRIALASGMWLNTNAITSITVLANNGNLQQYSHFALYGIKGE